MVIFGLFSFIQRQFAVKSFSAVSVSPLVKGDRVFLWVFFFLIYILFLFFFFRKMIIGNSVALNFTYNYNLFKSQRNSRWCGVRSCIQYRRSQF